MTEIVEMITIIGIITGSLFGLFRFEINKLCKEIDGIKTDIKEIHDKVYH
tara:strand:+ start:1272 stop:1421 length:150 start_codon:yes stop_codon:yes gene_type:complete